MGLQINLDPKIKKRVFPIWGIAVAIGLVNLVVFLVIKQSETEEYSIPLPGNQSRVIGGSIAFDGQSFWAAGMVVTFGARHERDIVQFDEEGMVLNVFTPAQDFCGLAFDGTNLWTADAAGSGPHSMSGAFYTVDRESGRLIEQFAMNRDCLLDGIAASEYRLWVIGRYRDREKEVFLWEVDQYSESIAHEVALPAEDLMYCTGITYFKEHIYAVADVDHRQVLKISTYDGRIVERYDYSWRRIYGITNNGKEVLVADGGAKNLYVLENNAEDATR